ncbi:tRNA (adenosine(37)-N6)-dimethylallyltransferase MiaA [Peribacillus saganii]|uniref:tRNA dimethylallyltransferase n=1 Tax=Peribacillus saganii TaxID=2303992 RepID=A0A372LUX5_9BACI|nr:tRNA (adenosine(37)-N6)-dimethylallyltransferase MiaA [Peribacillus saganii]RFU71374.1 tRNA (adenosine(37)-N6)-dimethylallyltransferase MiaA [Peribacillus saganii]
MNLEKEKLLVIIGPTAVGKTKLSVELAKRFNGEIISGDSMQVYKRMDIGTAKISVSEMDGIPHHLIDIKEPDEPFNANEFQRLATKFIKDIHKRGRLPIIAGGTGLYIQSVLHQYQFSEAPGDPEYRTELEQLAGKQGNEAVHALLHKVDPESAARIHPNNVRRVIRALEIFHSTDKTMSEQLIDQPLERNYDSLIVGLTMERELLYSRINKRVDLMMEQGLLQEVKSLFELGLKECQSIQAIGYKEIYAYLEGKITLEEAVEQLKQNSRRYAKRQLTWFRNKMDVSWFDMSDLREFEKKFNEISVYIAGKLAIKANR